MLVFFGKARIGSKLVHRAKKLASSQAQLEEKLVKRNAPGLLSNLRRQERYVASAIRQSGIKADVKAALEVFGKPMKLDIARDLYQAHTLMGTNAVTQLSIPVAFKTTKQAHMYLQLHPGELVDQLNVASAKRIKAAIHISEELGEAPHILELRVANILLGEELTRADRIMQTEIHQIGQLAEWDAFDQGGFKGKLWWSYPDARPAHADAYGQVRRIDEPFDVGDEDLMFPGDPDGSPGNICNCRCRIIPITAAEMERL